MVEEEGREFCCLMSESSKVDDELILSFRSEDARFQNNGRVEEDILEWLKGLRSRWEKFFLTTSKKTPMAASAISKQTSSSNPSFLKRSLSHTNEQKQLKLNTRARV